VTVARNPTHSGGHLFWSTHVTDALKRHFSCAIIVGHVHHWLPLRTKARSYWRVSTVGNWLVARYGKLTLSGQSQHSLFASLAGAPHIGPRLRKSVSSATAASTHRKKKRQMRPAPIKEHCAGDAADRIGGGGCRRGDGQATVAAVVAARTMTSVSMSASRGGGTPVAATSRCSGRCRHHSGGGGRPRPRLLLATGVGRRQVGGGGGTARAGGVGFGGCRFARALQPRPGAAAPAEVEGRCGRRLANAAGGGGWGGR